jgi:hypothetical protein
MMQNNEKVVKKGAFKGMAYSSAKKYACEKGELTLTTRNLLMDCEGSWSKSFLIREIGLEAWGENLEVYDRWYGRVLFRLIIDEPKEWEEAFHRVITEWATEEMKRFHEHMKKRPTELRRLLDISPEALKKLYSDTRRESLQFRRKNIRFNMEIRSLVETFKNRKLKAFAIAHSYVAWYEWTKRLLYKIHKAKFGKGPKNDEELMKFLDDYPSWKALMDTKEWGIRPNQIRNCVAHENFYFDYRHSELVFMIRGKKEKRVRLRDLKIKVLPISNLYATLIRSLEEKVTKGEISYKSSIF